jgi:integrase
MAKRTKDGIYLRGKVYWMQFRGKRFSLHVTDAKAAELAAKEHQRKAASPSYAASHDVSLSDACDAWLESLDTAAKPPAAGTRDMYGYHIAHFDRLLVGPLAGIDAAAVDSYVSRRRREDIPNTSPPRTTSASTVSKELGTLGQVLRLAARRGWFHRPLEQVMPPPMATGYRPLERALTWEQVPLLLAELDWNRAATACFLIGLGADRCAITRARLEDFTSRPGLVLVRGTKTPKRWAWVPVVEPFGKLVARAGAWMKAHGAFEEWRNAPRDLALACRRAGIPRITPRDLRRSFGQILRARGVPPSLLGPMLRHADSRMAETTYGQLKPDDLGRLVTQAAEAARSTGTPEVHATPQDAQNAE